MDEHRVCHTERNKSEREKQILYDRNKWSEMKVAQLCLTLCDPMNYTVHGILQARILEWVAYLFSRGSSQPRNRTQVSLIAGRFFTSWVTREVPFSHASHKLSVPIFLRYWNFLLILFTGFPAVFLINLFLLPIGFSVFYPHLSTFFLLFILFGRISFLYL